MVKQTDRQGETGDSQRRVGWAVKWGTFKPPTPEQVRRAEQRKQESARKYEARRRELARVNRPKTKRKPSRIRPNAERRRRLREAQYGPPGFMEWVHSLGCSVPSCTSQQIQAAHATSRGAGGKWEDILPLCQYHHQKQHQMGIRSFEKYVGFSLEDVAASVQLRWRAFAGDDQCNEPTDSAGLISE